MYITISQITFSFRILLKSSIMLLSCSALFDPYLLLPQSGAMGTGLLESADENREPF